MRSIVSRLLALNENALTDVANCPTQFQEYIPGTDVRFHVIGKSIVATEIRSVADDYRYASRSGANLVMAPTVLPKVVTDSCRLMLRDMNLSPGFTFFEATSSQPIAAWVADLLLQLDSQQ